jgi:hypothetical protein
MDRDLLDLATADTQQGSSPTVDDGLILLTDEDTLMISGGGRPEPFFPGGPIDPLGLPWGPGVPLVV